MEVFPNALSKLHSKCPKRTIRGIFLEKILFFHQFGRLRQIFQPFSRNFFGKVIKSSPYVSKQTVWRKKFSGKNVFWRSVDFREKFSSLCRNQIRRAVKATFYVSSRTFTGKMYIFGNCHIWMRNFWIFLVTFSHITMKFFCLFVKKSQERLSKLHSLSA